MVCAEARFWPLLRRRAQSGSTRLAAGENGSGCAGEQRAGILCPPLLFPGETGERSFFDHCGHRPGTRSSPGVPKHFEGAPCGQWGMGRVVALTGGLPLYSLLHCLDSERGQRHSDGLDGVRPPRAELTMSPAGHAGGSSTPWALFSHE